MFLALTLLRAFCIWTVLSDPRPEIALQNLCCFSVHFASLLVVLHKLVLSWIMHAQEEDPVPSQPAAASKPAPKPAAKPVPKPAPEPEPQDPVQQKKQAAAKEKDLGNAAYKRKAFDEAISHYNRAIELDDQDISFITNKCAACPSIIVLLLQHHDEKGKGGVAVNVIDQACTAFDQAISCYDQDISFITNKCAACVCVSLSLCPVAGRTCHLDVCLQGCYAFCAGRL